MDRHIKDVLGNYLKNSKIGDGYTSKRIENIWNEKMGPSVSAQTKSVKYKNGELKISIISSVLKYELFQNTQKIKEVINKELGSDIIESIRLD